jgi:hypothetical protein
VGADPPIQNIKQYDRVDHRSDLNFMKCNRVEIHPIQSLVQEPDSRQNEPLVIGPQRYRMGKGVGISEGT